MADPFLDDYRPRRKRNKGHPLRAFLEVHPTLLRGVFVVVATGALIYLVAHRFLFAH